LWKRYGGIGQFWSVFDEGGYGSDRMCLVRWFYSKAEFVLYKLKEMGSIQAHEIADISHQFDQLDVNNSGKISLCRLQEGN
jgi:hypothetical protein